MFDFGLSAALNREFARSRADTTARERRLLVTLEYMSWILAILLSIFLSILIAYETNLFGPGSIPSAELTTGLTLLAAAVTLQWPIGLYSGGLRGRNHQAILITVTAIWSAARFLGAALIAWQWGPSLIHFGEWYLLISLCHALSLHRALWSTLPKAETTARFDMSALRDIRRFAMGLSGIAILSIALTHWDKLILSTNLPLESYGHYIIAATLAGGLASVSIPFFNTYYPRYSALVAEGDSNTLNQAYHKSSQVIAVIVCSLGSFIVLFSSELLLLWTRNSEIASEMSPVLSILAFAAMLNGLMQLPYAMQLAHGWTRLAITMHIAAAVISMPTVVYFTYNHGAVAVASVAVMLNMFYIAVGVPMMHKKILKGQMRKWYLSDTLPALFTSLTAASIAKAVYASSYPQGNAVVVEMATAAMITIALTASTSATIRTQCISALRTAISRR